MVKKKAKMPTIEISCVEVWREISNYLDNEISVELRERMEAHFKACAHCTAILDGTRNVVEIAPKPGNLARIGRDQLRPGYPCTSRASNCLLCVSAKYLHSDLSGVWIARHLWASALSHASRNRRQCLLAAESRSRSRRALL